ncbi:MAG: hypothetical protein K2M78_11475 [Lachnospiraceae bacterium]|nr:hypothetical protein [Lachnospiraceae bacterium]
MSKRVPNVLVLTTDKIDFNNLVKNMKNDWNYQCEYEVKEDKKMTSYVFEYSNLTFVCSEFNARFPDDLHSEIIGSRFGENLEDIYDCHQSFWIVNTAESTESDLRIVYMMFTRVIMSMISGNKGCIIYDTRSRTAIESDVYLSMYNNMRICWEKDKSFFPIDFYVNICIEEINGKSSGYTIGFEIFNDYEIVIDEKAVSADELRKIMKFIIGNVVSRNDKIGNGDIFPIPLDGQYDEAISKRFSCEKLGKDALAIIF